MTSIPLPVAELKSALTGLAKLNSRQPADSIAQMIHIERKKDGWICLTSSDFDRFATVRLEQPSPGEPVALLVHPEDLQRVVKVCSRDETLELIPGNGDRITMRFPHQAFQPRNAWSLFNAFTAALKKSNLAELPKRTEALHGLLDSHVGLTLN